MAAKKIIRRKSAAHAGTTRAPTPARRSRSHRHRTLRPPARCSHARARVADADRPVRDVTELIDRLSNALALIETIAVALKEFEAQPVVGSICMALDQAIVVIGRAHADVEQLFERKRP